MRRLGGALLLLLGLLAGRCGAEEIPFQSCYLIRADLVEGRSDPRGAVFESLTLLGEGEVSEGRLTLRGGSFLWENGEGDSGLVEGEDRTFDLRRVPGGPEEVLLPWQGAGPVVFRGPAGTGLPGKRVEWVLGERRGAGWIPAFRTLERQKRSPVPQVALLTNPSGVVAGVRWCFADPSEPRKARRMPTLRFRVQVLPRGDRSRFPLLEEAPGRSLPPEGPMRVPGGILTGIVVVPPEGALRPEEVGAVRFLWTEEGFGFGRAWYGWEFRAVP